MVVLRNRRPPRMRPAGCAYTDPLKKYTTRGYSLNSENVTEIKRYTAQILSYKIFSFCEQILKIGANDASGQGLQYALLNRRQNKFLRKLQAFEVRYPLFSVKITRQFWEISTNLFFLPGAANGRKWCILPRATNST